MRLTPLNLWIFLIFSIKKINNFFKPVQVLNRRFFSVFGRFSSSMTGSCAYRFCGRLGPDAGPVHGPTGRTGRFNRLDRESDLNPVRVGRKTGMRMNRSLNRKTGRKSEKTGGSKPKPVLKNYLFVLIEKN
jgi:hypothetical protein